jgi:hypothetical protein
VIENGIFKEGKHPWHLQAFPQRNEAAVIVHCHFTLMMMGLCTAYRLWQAKAALDLEAMETPALLHLSPKAPSGRSVASLTQAPASSGEAAISTALLSGEGTARWRVRLKQENRDQIIVFVGAAYGIFHLAVFSILIGIRLRELPAHVGTKEAILARYGLSP